MSIFHTSLYVLYVGRMKKLIGYNMYFLPNTRRIYRKSAVKLSCGNVLDHLIFLIFTLCIIKFHVLNTGKLHLSLCWS